MVVQNYCTNLNCWQRVGMPCGHAQDATKDRVSQLVKGCGGTPEEEIESVRGLCIITGDEERQIDAAIKSLRDNSEKLITALIPDYEEGEEGHQRARFVKAILYRGLAIKKIYAEDHYVITHAQATRWFVVAQLRKILVNKYDPAYTVPPFFTFLRHPKQTNADNTDYYMKLIGSEETPDDVDDHYEVDDHSTEVIVSDETSDGVDDHSSEVIISDDETPDRIDDHTPEVRAALVASDLSFFSTRHVESALSFLDDNFSILDANDEVVMKAICTTILRDYLPDNDIQKIEDCAQKIYDLSQTINTLCGQLFVICIPKTFFVNNLAKIGYLSHPYGFVCTDYPDFDPISVVEQLQRGQLLPRCPKDDFRDDYHVPQFRLLGSAVTPETAQSFLISPLTEQQQADIYQQVLAAVETTIA